MGLNAFPLNVQPQRRGFLQRGDMRGSLRIVHMHTMIPGGRSDVNIIFQEECSGKTVFCRRKEILVAVQCKSRYNFRQPCSLYSQGRRAMMVGGQDQDH
jgi:hypothetical protein